MTSTMYDIKTMVERTFSSDTKEDRNQWIASIERVKAHILEDEATKSGNAIIETSNNNPFTNNQGFFNLNFNLEKQLSQYDRFIFCFVSNLFFFQVLHPEKETRNKKSHLIILNF